MVGFRKFFRSGVGFRAISVWLRIVALFRVRESLLLLDRLSFSLSAWRFENFEGIVFYWLKVLFVAFTVFSKFIFFSFFWDVVSNIGRFYGLVLGCERLRFYGLVLKYYVRMLNRYFSLYSIVRFIKYLYIFFSDFYNCFVR